MAGIEVTCPHCKKTLNASPTMAGTRTKCPACNGFISIPAVPDAGPGHQDMASNPVDIPPAAPPDRPAPQSAGGIGIKPPPLPKATEDQLLPWETPPELFQKAESYLESGQVRSFPCKVEEFLEGLLRPQVFASIKEKSKQGANLAEFHVYPDMVGVVQRPEEPGCLASLLGSFLPLQIVALIAVLISNLFGLAVLLVGGLIVLVVVISCLGFCGTIVAGLLLVGLGVGTNYLIAYLSQKNQDRIVARVRAEPKSPYAIKQLFKRTGWMRWRTGIGRGQSGAVMAERFWKKGDVVQLVRVDTRKNLLNRSLLLLVMDEPIPDDPGAARMGVVLVFRRIFRPTRRIYIVDVEGGSQAADAAANAASQVLDIPVRIGKFGRIALSLIG